MTDTLAAIARHRIAIAWGENQWGIVCRAVVEVCRHGVITEVFAQQPTIEGAVKELLESRDVFKHK